MQAFYYDSIDSTNDQAKRLVRSGEITDAAYVIAFEQTAGRGSRGKQWVGPRGAGIYLSVVEIPTCAKIAPTPMFTLAAGVACVEVLSECCAIEPRLKPVNDIYVDGGKLAGILCETEVSAGTIESVITGVGINVRKAERRVHKAAVPPISLEDAMPGDRFNNLDIESLVARLVVGIRSWNRVVFTGQFDRVQIAWRKWAMSETKLDSYLTR